MKYRCVIYGLNGKQSKDFDEYDKAYEYGLDYVLEKDWTASFDVKRVK